MDLERQKPQKDRQDYDVQLTRYDGRGWRATFYVTGMEHSPTEATGKAWEPTPWRAVQVAAWNAPSKRPGEEKEPPPAENGREGGPGVGVLYVASFNSVTAYLWPNAGNASPIRTLSGPATGLSHAQGLALDFRYNELVVLNAIPPSVNVYSRTASRSLSTRMRQSRLRV